MNEKDIREKDVAISIILTIVTCGIYGFYWLACLHDDLERESGVYSGTSSTLVIVLTIITCGIYGWYWLYKAGEKADIIKNQDLALQNPELQLQPSSDASVLYLILGLLGFSIVAYAIMQNDLNNHYITQHNIGM